MVKLKTSYLTEKPPLLIFAVKDYWEYSFAISSRPDTKMCGFTKDTRLPLNSV